MSNLSLDQPLSKWLTYSGPAREVAPQDGNYTWGGYTPSQVIDQQHYNIVLPAFDATLTTLALTTESGSILTTESGSELVLEQSNTPPYIAIQFDYTFIQPFTIINWPLLALQLNNFYVTIRYRMGNTVIRYKLTSAVTQGPLQTESGLDILTESGQELIIESVEPQFLPGTPFYTGQIILPNFVIEVWKLDGNPINPNLTLRAALNILTSIRYSPLTELDGDISVQPLAEYTTTLVRFPALFPIVFNPLAYWLTN